MKAGILLENIYEDLELWYPYYRLQEAEIDVKLIAPDKGATYTSKHGYPAISHIDAKSALKERFQLIVIPGGYAPDFMRRCREMIDLIKAAYREGAILASICHGGWMFCSAPDIIKGRNLTGAPSIRDDLTNAGALFIDQEVVVDGRIITSRRPSDLPAFTKAILSNLAKTE